MPDANTEDLEEITIRNYDEIADSWTAEMEVVSDWNDYAEKFQKLLPEGSVLEVGCGGGRDAKKLISLGFDYLGTDASAGMIRAATKNVPNAKFVVVNMYRLSEIGKKFDGFWSCAAFLHIPKNRINEALGEVNNTLNPGAIGFITMKNGNKEDFEVRDINGREESRLFVYWPKEEFEAALKYNGFEILEYEYKPVSERTNWHIFFVKKVD